MERYVIVPVQAQFVGAALCHRVSAPDELENGTLVAEDISHVGSACKEDTLY